MRTSSVYTLSKTAKNQEAVKMMAENMIQMCREKDLRVIGLTTSTRYVDYKKKAGKELAKAMSDAGYPTGYSEDGEGLEPSGKEKCLLVDIPPIHLFADGMNTAKKMDGVISVERYAYTRYKDFEVMLKALQEKNILFLGVVAHR